jgi:acetamidase/formamidase
VASVRSGTTVRIYSYTHYAAAAGTVSVLDELESTHFAVHSPMRDIHAAHCGSEAPGDRFRCGKPGPHLLTGPVYVEEAEPGDVLMVEVLTTEPFLDWGWNRVGPGVGHLVFLAPFVLYKSSFRCWVLFLFFVKTIS